MVTGDPHICRCRRQEPAFQWDPPSDSPGIGEAIGDAIERALDDQYEAIERALDDQYDAIERLLDGRAPASRETAAEVGVTAGEGFFVVVVLLVMAAAVGAIIGLVISSIGLAIS